MHVIDASWLCQGSGPELDDGDKIGNKDDSLTMQAYEVTGHIVIYAHSRLICINLSTVGSKHASGIIL
jgi:hypothetical protein